MVFENAVFKPNSKYPEFYDTGAMLCQLSLKASLLLVHSFVNDFVQLGWLANPFIAVTSLFVNNILRS